MGNLGEVGLCWKGRGRGEEKCGAPGPEKPLLLILQLWKKSGRASQDSPIIRTG